MEAAVKKEIGIDIFTLSFTALLFWLLVSTDLIINNPYILVLLLVFIIPIWISCLAIALALVSNYSATLLSLSIPMILVFFGITEPIYIVAAVIIAMLLASARFMFIHDMRSRVVYKTRSVFYSGTKLLVMALIILITGISMPYITESLMTEDAVIPESAVKWLIKPYEPYIMKNIPGAMSDASIDDTLDSMMQQRYSGNSEAINLQKEMFLSRSSDQAPVNSQVETSSAENISSLVTAVLNNQISSLTSDFPFITPIAIFSIVILVSRVVIPIITLSLLFSIASIIWLSRKAHLIKLLSISKPVEHLEL